MARILMTLESEFPHDERVEKEAFSLLAAGHEVHLLCYTRSHQPLEDHYKGIIIHRFAINKWIYKSSALSLQFPFYFAHWRRQIIRFLNQWPVDVVHIHDLPLISVVHGLQKQFAFKIMLDLHENWPVLMRISAFSHRFPTNLFFSFSRWKDYENQWVRQADGVITVIEEARERLAGLGIPREKIEVIQNTIDLNSFAVTTTSEKPIEWILLYSGGVNEHRGIQVVLKALKILFDGGLTMKLHIVGGGKYMDHLKQLAEESNIGHLLVDKGWQSFQDMMAEIVNSAVLIIPHLKSEHTDATIPNKLFQYMYAQKPLLVSDCKPMERIVNAEKAGIVYECTNEKELARQLKNIVENYDDHLQKARHNKATVEKKYHWGVEREKLIGFYLKLTKDKSDEYI